MSFFIFFSFPFNSEAPKMNTFFSFLLISGAPNTLSFPFPFLSFPPCSSFLFFSFLQWTHEQGVTLFCFDGVEDMNRSQRRSPRKSIIDAKGQSATRREHDGSSLDSQSVAASVVRLDRRRRIEAARRLWPRTRRKRRSSGAARLQSWKELRRKTRWLRGLMAVVISRRRWSASDAWNLPSVVDRSWRKRSASVLWPVV